MNLILPELWEPIGRPVERTLSDEELLALAANINDTDPEGLALHYHEDLRPRPDPAQRWQLQLDDDAQDENLYMGWGTTKEDARKDLVQRLMDGLRWTFHKHRELAGPKP